jgi:hypothetical protein
MAAGDAAALAEARLEAASLLLTLYGGYRAARVRPALRQWCQAGLVGALEVVADADEALRAPGPGGVGSEDAEAAAAASVGAWLAPVAEASPGSDLHVQLAARAAAAARRRAGEGWGAPGDTAAAQLACARAHVARYGGGLEPEAALRLVALSEQLALEGVAAYGSGGGAGGGGGGAAGTGPAAAGA